jgi:phytoene synthase
MARAVGGPEAWPEYFGRHARTFRFAARLFPAEQARRIAEVYAFCRFTDDLVDEPADGAAPETVAQRLDAWRSLTRAAFEGHVTGVPILDVTLARAAGAGVSWLYPDALLHGVGLDLSRARYADWEELESYTFGVAAAVGGWITQLFGFRDPELLERAHALGHALQLTNIVRDVGEDLARDRVYLPLRLLEAHGLDEGRLRALARGSGPLPSAYKAAVEDLMARADAWYDRAWPGIQALPGWYRRPVAVAAEAYRGIHQEVRRAGHDNLRRRAATGLSTKVLRGAAGLFRARTGS